EIVIVQNRTNAGTLRSTCRILDLVLVVDSATIADKYRARELLIEHDAHLSFEPCHDIEVSDVDDVIPVQFLLLVDRGRRGDTLRPSEELLLLQIALDVT